MKKVLNSSQMREVDRLSTERFHIPSLLLMECAALASRKALAHLLKDAGRQRVLIVCGPGNNGGDGAALARHLHLDGYELDLVLLGDISSTKGDARQNFEIIRSLSDLDISVRFIQCNSEPEFLKWSGSAPCYGMAVDAIFGTGLTRAPEGLHLSAIRFLNKQDLILSLDLPSGLDANAAKPPGEAVRADLTVTFTSPKPAHLLSPSRNRCGQIHVADIGSPQILIDEIQSDTFMVEKSDAQDWLRQTRYTPDSYKNSHGHVLVLAGSRTMTGAAVLTSEAALHSGAGLVTVASSQSAINAIASRVTPEIMTIPLPETAVGSIKSTLPEEDLFSRATVVAIGPGLGKNDETSGFVRSLIDSRRCPVVIDADGLNALAPWPEGLHGSDELPLILTPHAGEMRRLLGINSGDLMKMAGEFAVKNHLIVVLKGSPTITINPKGEFFINSTGNAGLGTAGSGDTLTGIIAGFAAQTVGNSCTDILKSTISAVYIAGFAADLAAEELGMRSMIASDTRKMLSQAITSLDPGGEFPKQSL
jgi:ADP-dependent NAD(P)H-hydrate dehydratase / NAD(P)H-hydrate epimerase